MAVGVAARLSKQTGHIQFARRYASQNDRLARWLLAGRKFEENGIVSLAPNVNSLQLEVKSRCLRGLRGLRNRRSIMSEEKSKVELRRQMWSPTLAAPKHRELAASIRVPIPLPIPIRIHVPTLDPIPKLRT